MAKNQEAQVAPQSDLPSLPSLPPEAPAAKRIQIRPGAEGWELAIQGFAPVRVGSYADAVRQGFAHAKVGRAVTLTHTRTITIG